MEADVCGRIGLYARKGQFRLDVERLETTGGDGLWSVARERLIAQLRSEGLLDEARKRPLPAYPERIGLVTSGKGAALQDMWRVMRRRAWWIRVLVSECSVEGAAAAPDIARALGRFGAGPGQCPVDLVIVARGGGSRESLWAFNTEPVARAVAACPVPVISAVGHETDYTVCDLVADLRASTPTAGAEHATPEGAELLQRLNVYPARARQRLQRSMVQRTGHLEQVEQTARRRMERRSDMLLERLAALERETQARAPWERQRRFEERLESLATAIRRSAEERHASETERLENLTADTKQAFALRLERTEQRLARFAAEADAKSPLKAIARGYAVVRVEGSSRIVRSPADARAGTPLSVRLAGGTLAATSRGAIPEPEERDA